MAGADVAHSLQKLHERARRLLSRASAYLDELTGDDLPGDGVEPVRLALSRLDMLLREGADSVLSQIRSTPSPDEGPSATRVHTILEVTRALSHVLEEDALFELIMDLVIEHSKAERGFLVLSDGDGGFTVRAARNIEHETIEEAEREMSHSIIRRVWETGEPLLVPNALADATFGLKESVVALRILSVVCAPIKVDDEMYGAVYLESRSVQDLFDDTDVAFVRTFTEQAGVALKNARAYREVRDAEHRLELENVRLRAEVADRHTYEGILGRGSRMQEIFELIERIGPKPVSVLIRGANGTGKELAARAVHYKSPRAEGPFVSVNCAALPETLIESELFGIEKGTATGVEARPGKFEVASGGTLFLDEVGDMSLVTQAKLLRVLQEREIERVGGRKTLPVDVRIIAATNADLETAIVEKRFREDLYYRLNVVQLHIPALRDRVEDIPLLAMHFLKRSSTEFGTGPRRLSPEALDCLCNFEWPGNVRQLENVISRAVVLSQGKEIGVDLLPPDVQASGAGQEAPGLSLAGNTLEGLEQAALIQALEKNDWVQTRAASELGISERNLRYKMKKFQIQRPQRGQSGASPTSPSGSA